jgi:hypothetical protein
VTAQPLSPVIPRSGTAVSRERAGRAAARRLPLARRDPGGMVELPPTAFIPIPAALRRRCGLVPGDQVLLAALPDQDALTAYCLAVVDQALRAHGSFPHARAQGVQR